MELLTDIIDALVFAAVGLTFLKSYLHINKVWSRRSNVEVANSVSIYANIISFVAMLPFFIKYAFIEHDIGGALQALITLLTVLFFLTLGSGYWVRSAVKKESFWTKFLKAVRLEKNESGNLFKALTAPNDAIIIIDILKHISHIDGNADENEIQLIKKFADNWDIDYKVEHPIELATSTDYLKIKHMVQAYLDTFPSNEQVSELIDIINMLIHSDKSITDEEKIIQDEIEGMVSNYIQSGSDKNRYEVIIIPQSLEQESTLEDILPNMPKSSIKGGVSYIAGEFYSLDFARIICKRYRNMNLFTVVEVND